MPNLIGLTAAKAIEVVEGLGRKIDFGGGPCQDRQRRGRVVTQNPDPGRALFPNGNAIDVNLDRVWLCSRGSTTRACAPKDLKFETFARHDHGDGEPIGAMLVGVDIKNRGESPCQLTGTGSIQLHRSRNPDAFVRGSPKRFDFDIRLNPGDSIPAAGWWYSWCGSRSGNWRVEAEVGGYHGEAHLQEPDCDHRDDDSFLV
jgi:hypothetical protein